jgi:hypothetical protein
LDSARNNSRSAAGAEAGDGSSPRDFIGTLEASHGNELREGCDLCCRAGSVWLPAATWVRLGFIFPVLVLARDCAAFGSPFCCPSERLIAPAPQVRNVEKPQRTTAMSPYRNEVLSRPKTFESIDFLESEIKFVGIF